MKISSDNSTIINAFGNKESLRLMKEAGFDGIDYSFCEIKPEHDLLCLGDGEREQKAAELKEYAAELGLTFWQCHAELKYKYGTIEADPAHPMYQRVIRSMEYASRMGIPQIVIHSLRCPIGMDRETEDNINYEFMRSFVPYAEKYGVKIGVENLFKRKKLDDAGNCIFYGRNNTAEWMNSFVDRLDSSVFNVCCDIGHAVITGSDPAEFIRGMDAKRLTMLHVQDTDGKEDRHWLPYLGTHNWESILDALAETGFDGYMNLEVLHFYDKFPKDIMPEAMKLAAMTARDLAARLDAKKAALNK